jgi:hypothetical protein
MPKQTIIPTKIFYLPILRLLSVTLEQNTETKMTERSPHVWAIVTAIYEANMIDKFESVLPAKSNPEQIKI